MDSSLYISGAGVSKGSGIPTFRGGDGYWRIGSKNYTPQEIATRAAYMSVPDEFLFWYYLKSLFVFRLKRVLGVFCQFVF